MVFIEMALVLLVWFALPLPLAVLVGRAFRVSAPERPTQGRADYRLTA